jgi:hypothetical protein
MVLHDSTTTQDVIGFAAAFRMELSHEQQADPDHGTGHTASWQSLDRRATLHYIEDITSGHRYVLIEAQNQRIVAALAQTLAETITVWTSNDLCTACASAERPQARAQAVLRLGVGAPDTYDQRVYAIVSAALTDPAAEVRDAALWAVAYSSYPEYRSDLQNMAVNDPNPDLRHRAHLTLDAYAGHGLTT